MSQTFKNFVTDDSTITLDKTPKRIAVLGYPDYDTMKALGLEDAIVASPKTRVPNYIGDIPDRIANTVNLHDPELDVIRDQQPDLIIATGRSRQSIPELEKIAPVFLYETTSEDYWVNFRDINIELGKILDKETEVEAIIKDIDEQASFIQAYNESHTTEETLTLMLSEGEYKDFSKHSRFAFIYQYLHFDVSGHEETDSSHGDAITAETINALNPERIFFIDRNKAVNGEPDKSLLDNNQLKDTQAFEDGHVYELNAELWYLGGGGLTSTPLQLEEVRRSIQ